MQQKWLLGVGHRRKLTLTGDKLTPRRSGCQRVCPHPRRGCQIAAGSSVELVVLLSGKEKGWEKGARSCTCSHAPPTPQITVGLPSQASTAHMVFLKIVTVTAASSFFSFKIIVPSAVDHCTPSRWCLSNQ